MRARTVPAADPGHAPLTRRELDAWVEHLVATAARMRAEHGQCPPTALVVVNRVSLAVETVLQSDDDKHTLRALFEVAARGGAEGCALVAEGCALVAEGWRVGGAAGKLRRAIRRALDGSLAGMRGRKEILFVHAVSARAEVLRVFDVTKGGALRSGPSRSGVPSRFLTALPWATDKTRGPSARRRNDGSASLTLVSRPSVGGHAPSAVRRRNAR